MWHQLLVRLRLVDGSLLLGLEKRFGMRLRVIAAVQRWMTAQGGVTGVEAAMTLTVTEEREGLNRKKRMQQIMTQCFLAVKSKLVCRLGFFDLIGCDFMVDEDFKVWLLEMNCNPALHTNCKVLKEVIPSTVVETLDLTLEIFNKCRLRQRILPLASQRDFVLLYNGATHDPKSSKTQQKTRIIMALSSLALSEEMSVCDSPETMLSPPQAGPPVCGDKPERREEPEAETRLRGTDSSSIMGCCSVTQRHTGGVDEVGPDEIELLELSGDNLGTRDELRHRIYSQQPIRGWEGQPAHMYGEVIHSSLVSLYNSYTQETNEHFLVLFSFHLLILSLDHARQDFIYEGILPLSGLTFQAGSLGPDTSHPPHMFEISGPMVDSKVFICASAAELQKWMQHIEDRRLKSMTQPMSPSHCALSYLLPCDVRWKREELLKYLLQAPIWQWEGSPIQHMGQPGYISIVHIINSQRQEEGPVILPQAILHPLVMDNKH
ncbi:uncharacterized protein AKAME5_002608800 [Lates japonicus]|uniref:PH domain-containing protein n=1 Tax=Lates japonicus TaxID=270547 RepID=A0AAD3NKU5_LATJO|nr:uncharacterized protein AKAME5_002608800 [Lates japonicus]